MFTTVILAGDLSDRGFPQKVEGIAHTLSEAMRMTFCNAPNLKEYLAKNDFYQVSLIQNLPSGQKSEHIITSLSPEFPIYGKTIIITPIVAGSGNIGGLIGGLALVTLGVITGGSSLIVAGAVMAAQSLFYGYGDAPSDKDNKQSEILGTGNLNTAEGNPIPVVYGNDVLVSDLQVLSFAIKTELSVP